MPLRWPDFLKRASCHSSHVTLLGVIYDPFLDELWTAVRGQPARCNDRVIHVSKRTEASEAIVAIGFFEQPMSLMTQKRHDELPTARDIVHDRMVLTR